MTKLFIPGIFGTSEFEVAEPRSLAGMRYRGFAGLPAACPVSTFTPTRFVRDGMTSAHDRFTKLEAAGWWRASPGAAGEEVILSFGSRTLVLIGLDDKALGHWPLATLRARTPLGARPTVIAPDHLSDEQVTIDDVDMVAALDEVCPDLYVSVVPEAPARRRRIGWLPIMLFLIAAAGFAAYRALPMLAPYIPAEQARLLDDTVLAELALEPDGSSPKVCREADGHAALQALQRRLSVNTDFTIKIIVAKSDAPRSVILPSGTVVVFSGLLDAVRSPEEFAAVLAHQAGHVRAKDQLSRLLATVGPIGALELIFGQSINEDTHQAAARAALSPDFTEEMEVSADRLAYDQLGAAELPTTGLVDLQARLSAARSFTSEHPGPADRGSRAVGADAIADGAFTPAVDDRAWLALQNICDVTGPFPKSLH